jgi:glutathione S-transferase
MIPPLTLFVDWYWISPYAFSGFVALKEKGVPFDATEVKLHEKDHHREEYRTGSVTGRVPALRHGDFWLAESNAICEYLEDVFPAPAYRRLYPEDIRQRARARMIQAWVRSDLMPIRDERPTSTMFYERAQQPLSPRAQVAVETLFRVAGQLIPDKATSLFGEWSIADADLSFMLHRLILNGHEIPPRLRAFADAQWQRPSVQEWVKHARPATYVPYH